MSDYSVHDEDGFARVYDEDDILEVRKGDLRGLLDLATGSMNFASGFWNNEDVEIAQGIARLLGLDPRDATPGNFLCTYFGHEMQWHPTESEQDLQERMPDWEQDHWYRKWLRPHWQCTHCRHGLDEEVDEHGNPIEGDPK